MAVDHPVIGVGQDRNPVFEPVERTESLGKSERLAELLRKEVLGVHSERVADNQEPQGRGLIRERSGL